MRDKLAYYGFRGFSQLLIKSYLSNRQQYEPINGFESSKLDITCGVPQGSTLEPLLFLLYINGLRFSLKRSIASHFADNTSITYASRKMKSLETVLNQDLKMTSDWLKGNRFSLNVDNSELILFKSKRKRFDNNNFSIKINGRKMEPTNHVKYLGLYLDENLSWSVHINQLCKKLSRSNGILSKVRQFYLEEQLYPYIMQFSAHICCMVACMVTGD